MISSALTDVGLAPGAPAFWIALVLALAAAASAGFLIAARRRLDRLSRAHENVRVRLAAEEQRAAEAGDLKDALEAERERRVALESARAADKARLHERERAHDEMKARLEAEFKAMSADLLKGAHASFLERAKETFDLYRQSASAEGDKRRKALDDLLKPVSETLTRYEKGLAEMREEQARSRGALANQIGQLAKETHDVRAEAQKLATALRAGPKTRGRWGEEQLKNVVEIAGMSAHVDFTEQASHNDGDKRKIPDMVVSLPGGRKIAVDSKVSLGAYLDAVEAETEEARAAALHQHADALWAHVKSLSAKDYAAAFRDSLDYTVLFLPGEHFFSAALDVRPDLYQKAFEQKILVATPTILIAVLKSAALNWRQEKMTEHAHKVAGMAKDLYDSLGTLAGHVKSLGKSLEGAVRHYNAGVGSLEGRVLSRARNFAELQLPGIDKPIPETGEIEGAVRELRAEPDLALDFRGDAEKDDAA
ncbi:MAG: DNA recombination protein RmuC [Pseudomonadota bacterium]